MLKAVICDDEYIVLEGLRRMIDWERYGVQLAGTAADGLTALQLLRDSRPDIVLTDIRMPGMDGLQLIETAASELPQTMFIVFSGFNEFDYVRRAIGLGVVDYLEKPITVAKIEEVLRKTIQRIDREQAYTEMKQKLVSSHSELLEKATLDLLLAGSKAAAKWREVYGSLAAGEIAGVTAIAFREQHAELPEHASYDVIRVTNGNEYVSLVLHRELPPEALWDALLLVSSAETVTVPEAVAEAAEVADVTSSTELASGTAGALSGALGAGNMAQGASPPSGRGAAGNSTAGSSEQAGVDGELGGTARTALGSGRTYASLEEATRSYREALRALRYGLFLEENGWTRIEDVEGRDGSSMLAELPRHEEAVIVSLRTGDREGMQQALDGFEAWTEEQKLPPERVEQELLKLLYLALEIARESGGEPPGLAEIHHLELHEMYAREEMFRWLRAKLEALLSWVAGGRRSQRHPAVEKALHYMNERYGQDVSLQELAEHVGLNPAYFSLLFKEQMGISYIKHLTRLRMEHAKSLLRSGLRVQEVSERVGYLNYRHFTELFKKIVGMTPGQYRDARQGGK